MTRWFIHLIALLCCLPALVAADDFYWAAGDRVTYRASSPAQSCQLAYDAKDGIKGPLSWKFVEPQRVLCSWYCEGSCSSGMWIYRWGDNCPAGAEYDQATGACKVPEPPKDCASTVGELFPARGPISPVIESGGRFYVAGPPASSITACYESCRYGDGARASSCYRVPKSDSQGFCNYVLKGNGESCSADAYEFATTGDPLNPGADPDDPSVPPSDPDDPGCPSGWAWSGTTCVKDPNANGGGEGEGNGNGEGGDEGGSGGGGSGNGSGNGEDGEGSGSGEEGDGNGEGNGSGSGEGEGESEGEGDCDPATDPAQCEGVPGPSNELTEPNAGSWDEANAEWDEKLEQVKAEFKEKVKQNVEGMKGAFDLNLGTGAGQLPCESFSVFGQTYSICLSEYAQTLSSLRYVLLLIAAVIAAFVILKD